ncbi:hypothetical protein BH11GEM1_BH11GEM1_00090 [soil metagenome]
MHALHRIAVVALVLAARPHAAAFAQGVVITPHFVFVTDRDKSTTIDLYNSGGASADISLSTVFGTYKTDSVGGIVVVADTNPRADAPSAAKWFDVYPRHVILRANSHQVLKILAVPPAGLPDGEYRTRLIVAAKSDVPPPAAQGTTTIALNVEIQTSLSMIYRQGSMSSGIKISDVRATVNGDYLDVRMHLEKTGNASFFGKLRGGLLAAGGRVIAPLDVNLAMNETMEPRFRLPLGDLKSGTYSLRLNIASDRLDIPPDVVVPVARERWEGNITVQRGY